MPLQHNILRNSGIIRTRALLYFTVSKIGWQISTGFVTYFLFTFGAQSFQLSACIFEEGCQYINLYQKRCFLGAVRVKTYYSNIFFWVSDLSRRPFYVKKMSTTLFEVKAYGLSSESDFLQLVSSEHDTYGSLGYHLPKDAHDRPAEENTFDCKNKTKNDHFLPQMTKIFTYKNKTSN